MNIYGDMGVYTWNNMGNVLQDCNSGDVDLIVHLGGESDISPHARRLENCVSCFVFLPRKMYDWWFMPGSPVCSVFRLVFLFSYKTLATQITPTMKARAMKFVEMVTCPRGRRFVICIATAVPCCACVARSECPPKLQATTTVCNSSSVWFSVSLSCSGCFCILCNAFLFLPDPVQLLVDAGRWQPRILRRS